MSPSLARGLLGAFVVLAAISLMALRAPWRSADDAIDPTVAAALAERVRHGGSAYAVLGDVMRVGPVADRAWRQPLPTLAIVESVVPEPVALLAEAALAMLMMIAWYGRLRSLGLRPDALTAALLLLALGMAVTLRLALVALPEGWAGLLAALALARSAPGRTVEPAALGLAAAVIAQAALPLLAVMSVAALLRHERRAVLAWGVALLLALVMLALHARAVTEAGALDGGIGLAGTLAALPLATGLQYLPLALGAPLALLAIAGWAASRRAAGGETAALIVITLLATAAIGTPAWLLVIAPVLPLGLLVLPDAVRSLLAAALDRRRITVTRLSR